MPELTSEIQLEMKEAEPEEGSPDKEQDGETKALENELGGDDNKKKEPYDAMRNEPHLVNLVVESYLGEQDERGFFHGIGTAYFKGNHVYSGSFVNGLMDGTGQYIWSNGIKYEGDFKNNMIEGRGTYSWPDESTYDGDVLNGLRHGQGTYVCGTIPSSYTGEWKYGKRSGEGILRYDKEGLSYYDGHWMDNRRHGFGMRRYASGNIYKGDWRDNVRHGTGTMHWYDKNERYEGQWENGIQHGHGEHSWFLKRIPGSQYPLRNYYVGEWVNGMRHGHGTFYYATGAKHVGEWMNNMKHGNGKYVFKNGMVFEGKSYSIQTHLQIMKKFIILRHNPCRRNQTWCWHATQNHSGKRCATLCQSINLILLSRCLLIQSCFCAVYNNSGKAGFTFSIWATDWKYKKKIGGNHTFSGDNDNY